MKLPNLFKQQIEEPLSKKYYRKYLADTEVRTLNQKLIEIILSYSPKTVFEFGAGRGKNLKLLTDTKPTVKALGIDISKNNIKKKVFDGLKVGTEDDLPNLGRFDVVFTCSVLDHIEYISSIITSFKEMANTIVIAETNSYDDRFYYKHNYEGYGFKKLDYVYCSNGIHGDGATYEIWTWNK